MIDRFFRLRPGRCLRALPVALLLVGGCSGTSHYVMKPAPSDPGCRLVIRDKQDGEVCAIDGKAGANKYSFWTMNAFPVVPGEGCPNEYRYNDETNGTFEAELGPGQHVILVKPWDGYAIPTNVAFQCDPGKTYTVKMSRSVVGTTTDSTLKIEHGVWQAGVVEAAK